MKLLFKFKHTLPSIARKETGATMVEYVIMASLIAVVSVIIVTGMGRELSTTFGTVSNSLVNMNN